MTNSLIRIKRQQDAHNNMIKLTVRMFELETHAIRNIHVQDVSLSLFVWLGQNEVDIQ